MFARRPDITATVVPGLAPGPMDDGGRNGGGQQDMAMDCGNKCRDDSFRAKRLSRAGKKHATCAFCAHWLPLLLGPGVASWLASPGEPPAQPGFLTGAVFRGGTRCLGGCGGDGAAAAHDAVAPDERASGRYGAALLMGWRLRRGGGVSGTIGRTRGRTPGRRGRGMPWRRGSAGWRR